MSEKYQANPPRMADGLERLGALRDLIYGFADDFNDGLKNAWVVLGEDGDDFARTSGRALDSMKIGLYEAVHGAGDVVDATMEKLKSQQRAVKLTNLGVVESIHEAGAHQGEGTPGSGGKSGKY